MDTHPEYLLNQPCFQMTKHRNHPSRCLPAQDRQRLHTHGLRTCALCLNASGARVPAWLEKWAALALAFCETERRELPAELLALPPVNGLKLYTPENAQGQAAGAHSAVAAMRVPLPCSGWSSLKCGSLDGRAWATPFAQACRE